MYRLEIYVYIYTFILFMQDWKQYQDILHISTIYLHASNLATVGQSSTDGNKKFQRLLIKLLTSKNTLHEGKLLPILLYI